MAPGAPGGTRYYRKPPITSLTSQLIPSVRPGQARNQYTSGSMRLYLRLGKKGRRTAWSQVSCEQAHLCKFGENYLAAEPTREEKWVEWRVRRPRGGGRGYFLTRSSQEANGDVPLDGVAFSRLEWLEWGCTFSDFWGVLQFFIFTVSKRTRMFVPQMKSKVFFIRCKKWINS